MPPEQGIHRDVQFVDAAGSRTAVFGYGAPDAPAVLAVHGFRGTHLGLAPLARALAARGCRVLVPDLPSTGLSSPVDRLHDLSGHVRWLDVLSDRLDVPPVLLGHSFGSVVVAASVAEGIRHRAVVLVNPIAALPLDVSRRCAVAAARAYYWLADVLPPSVARPLLASKVVAVLSSELMAESPSRELRRWMRAEHIRQAGMFADRDAVLETFRASVTSTVCDFGARFPAPALLLAGERDPLGPVASQERLAALVPDGTLSVLPHVGHLTHYEAPDAVAEMTTKWLRERSIVPLPESTDL